MRGKKFKEIVSFIPYKEQTTEDFETKGQQYHTIN